MTGDNGKVVLEHTITVQGKPKRLRLAQFEDELIIMEHDGNGWHNLKKYKLMNDVRGTFHNDNAYRMAFSDYHLIISKGERA